jgi:hypothetical protein
MFINMPHKKMKKLNRLGFVGKCDCGHVHRFKGKEIDLDKSNGATTTFKDVYKCLKCGQTYDGIFQSIPDRDAWHRKLSPIVTLITVILVFGLVFGGYKFITTVSQSPSQPTSINDMTNKQYDEFMKWDHDQQQKKWENQKVNK